MQLGLNSRLFYTVLRLVVCSVLFSYTKRNKTGDYVPTQLTNLSRISELRTHSPWKRQILKARSISYSFRSSSVLRCVFVGIFFQSFWFWAIWRALRNLDASMTTCCMVNANIVYSYFQKGGRKKCTHNPERYWGWLSRTHLLIPNPLLLAFRILHFSEILSVDKDTTNVLHHLKSISFGDVCYLTNTV